MRTLPCNHVILCRACFVRTIQSAVSQRHLPLTCVLCRQRVLKVSRVGISASSAQVANTQKDAANKYKRADAYRSINSDTKYARKPPAMFSSSLMTSSFKKCSKQRYSKLQPLAEVGGDCSRYNGDRDGLGLLVDRESKGHDPNRSELQDTMVMEGANNTISGDLGELRSDKTELASITRVVAGESPTSTTPEARLQNTDVTDLQVDSGEVDQLDLKLTEEEEDHEDVKPRDLRKHDTFKRRLQQRVKTVLSSIPFKFNRNELRYEIF